jgi:hypothetical protein
VAEKASETGMLSIFDGAEVESGISIRMGCVPDVHLLISVAENGILRMMDCDRVSWELESEIEKGRMSKSACS